MSITKQRQQSAYLALKEAFGYTSPMQGPRILKVVVSTGVGKKRDKKQIELIENRLAKITGQKPSARPARISIASFKARGCTTSSTSSSISRSRARATSAG